MRLACLALLIGIALATVRPVTGYYGLGGSYDESFYLGMATSMAYDHDWTLRNNLADLKYLALPRDLYTWDCVFPIGASLCMVPVFAWGAARGLSWDSQIWLVGLWSAGWAIFGVALVASALSRFVGRVAWICATVAFLSVPAWYYAFAIPGYSHGFNALACAVFVWAVVKDCLTTGRLILCGSLLGAVYLTRWADVVPFGLFAGAIYLFEPKRRWRGWSVFFAVSGAALAFLLVASVQWAFWHHEFGVWYLEPQTRLPRWPNGMMAWGSPVWSDLARLWPECIGVPVAVALLALSLMRRGPGAALKVAALLGLCAGVYLQMACIDRGGAQWGLRRLSGLYPLVALGLAAPLFRKERTT